MSTLFLPRFINVLTSSNHHSLPQVWQSLTITPSTVDLLSAMSSMNDDYKQDHGRYFHLAVLRPGPPRSTLPSSRRDFLPCYRGPVQPNSRLHSKTGGKGSSPGTNSLTAPSASGGILAKSPTSYTTRRRKFFSSDLSSSFHPSCR